MSVNYIVMNFKYIKDFVSRLSFFVYVLIVCFFLNPVITLAQDFDQESENNVSHSKIDFENAVKSGEVLELQYVFSTNPNNIHVPPVFYLYIYTGVNKRSFAITLRQGEHSLYFYPHLFNADITSMIIEVPRIFIQTFGSAEAVLQPTILRYTLINALKTWNNALPASIQDILNWQKESADNILYDSVEIGFGLAPAPIQQDQATQAIDIKDDKKNDVPFIRDGIVFRWQSYQKTFVFLFESSVQQAKYLKRLAFFVEKKGTRGKILSDLQLKNRFGWGAHDYKPDDLARFFEVARLENIVLNDYEYELKNVLLDLGILTYGEQNIVDIKNVKVKSGEGYIASTSRTPSYGVQNVLLTHEIMHAWYFENAQLRAAVHKVWTATSDILKKSFKTFLASNSYDSSFQYLVENEFFAYLLQRPISDLLWYASAQFIRGTLSEKEIAQLKNEFIDAAQTLEEYVGLHYQVQAGFLEHVIKF